MFILETINEEKEFVPNEFPEVQKIKNSKTLEFFPNSCAICQSTTASLTRCSCCKMVSYCSTSHQIDHWADHNEFCREIYNLIKEQGVSHLYENLQGLDLQTLKVQKDVLLEEIEDRLGRVVTVHEEAVLTFPRVCFVCYEARQESLSNCPSCPSASFCRKHPSSPLHDQDCLRMQKIHQMSALINSANQIMLLEIMDPIITNIRIDESSALPGSMKEFLDLYAKPGMNFTENEMIFLSSYCDEPLTVFNALKKLNFCRHQLIIHVEGVRSSTNAMDTATYWEILFHLLPNLKRMKIVFVEAECPRELEIILCDNCVSSGKKMWMESNIFSYLEYMKRKDFENPSIIVFFNVLPEALDNKLLIAWQIQITRCSEINCPLVFTTNGKTEYDSLKKVLKSSLRSYYTSYEGLNSFASFSYSRYWDGRLCLPNKFLIAIKPGKTENLSQDTFYAAYCPVCFSADASFICKYCKMIFYCGEAHRQKDLPYHKEICKVIAGMLDEGGMRNIFEELTTPYPKKWLKVKVDLMLQAKEKLRRELSKFEKEMFLYPKTCFVCHKSDVKLLRNCKCGVNLCKTHENDYRHIHLCGHLSLALKLSIMEEPLGLKEFIKATSEIPVPYSMEEFLNSFIQLQKENTNLQKIIISNLHTRPLTLLYAVKKLNLMIDFLMVVHVIGAIGTEVGGCAYWMTILYLLEQVKILKIVFIGPQVFSMNDGLENFIDDCLSNDEESLKVECHALQYEEYCQSESFIQPNIVVGYNLNLHECELQIVECTWKDTILALEKQEVPFVLTAGTANRAQEDHNRLCKLLGKPIDYLWFKQNPFAGFIPERDYETEELLYSNQYVLIYDGLFENVKMRENILTESPSADCVIT